VKPLFAVLGAIVLAIAANVFIFSTRSDLSAVAGQTVFVNSMAVLTLVPLYMVMMLKQNVLSHDMPKRVKEGLKAVAIFTLCMALVTFILFKTSGDYLIHERLAKVQQLLSESGLTAEEQAQRLESARSIYSPATQVLFGTLAMLITGFISSIIAAVAVKVR
jgi:capsule polysaccharide modification protein KpsS